MIMDCPTMVISERQPAAAGEILVVEDSSASLRLLTDILVEAGYSVRQAQDGEMALLTVRSLLPELILLDITMPIVDGYQVCQRLKANPCTRDIPVIFLSALHDTEDKVRGFAFGAVDFIAKPYQAEEVLARVQTHLELRRLRVSLELRVQQRTAELESVARTLSEEVVVRRKAEEDLRLAGKVFESTFDGILVTNRDGEIVSVNPSFTRITGYSKQEVMGKDPRFLRCTRQSREFYADMWEAITTTGVWSGEIWNRCKDGNTVPMMETIKAVREANGEVSHYFATLIDLSESKDAQTLINFLAYHDALTGLPNRVVARQHFEQVTSDTGNPQGQVAVMCFDLDRFTLINDSLGHNVGDQVLKLLANKFPTCLEGRDMISRHGGDEFLVVSRSVANADEARDLAMCLLGEIGKELHVDGRKLMVSTSIGIALYPNDGTSLDDLIRCADNALTQAKKQGGNTYCFFAAEMDVEARARMEMETQLRDAISNAEFELFYQPKVNLATGRISGAEALLRWNNPVLGRVSPADFIPLAEETGLILALDVWVLNTVCAQIRRWIDAGLGKIKVSANLSALQFHQRNLLSVVESALQDNGVAADCLDLEITEGALVENTGGAIAVLKMLKEIGVSISVDDFGTGYSSLSYLKNFPVDTLKIDKSFIDDVHVNSSDAAIALTIIELSRNLGMTVIAEGVENREQYDFLREHGCDEIQGYYFSRPITAGEFESLFRAG
jgi:diguanylate cyclase (GGDEF)-like protein/PAS domain S-box-containing protein